MFKSAPFHVSFVSCSSFERFRKLEKLGFFLEIILNVFPVFKFFKLVVFEALKLYVRQVRRLKGAMRPLRSRVFFVFFYVF